ncbi:MAG: hypothetical protein IJW51_00840 [Clostridia bacterium]|nr:hypothetical protein [Clostridia bacterium]
MLELKDLIPAVAGLMSITGHEGYDAARLAALFDGFEESYTDAVGNRVFVRRCGRENAPKILIDTHFDEIGLLVTDIKEGGFLSVTSVGGLDRRTLSSARVRVYGKEVIDGVITSTPPHLSSGERTLPAVEDLLIDTGYDTEVLRQLVRIGTPVGFAPEYRTLAGGRLSGKGFDNKACAAIAAHALMGLPAEALAGDVYLLLAVHEETDPVGGTAVGGFAIAPDYAMVIDVGLGFMRGADKRECITMGGGPAIARSAIVDRRLTAMTEALATRENIPWQTVVEAKSTGTDTECLHLVGGGISVVDVGLPLTAMHTYTEVLDLADAEALSRLVAAFVTDRELAEVFSYA